MRSKACFGDIFLAYRLQRARSTKAFASRQSATRTTSSHLSLGSRQCLCDHHVGSLSYCNKHTLRRQHVDRNTTPKAASDATDGHSQEEEEATRLASQVCLDIHRTSSTCTLGFDACAHSHTGECYRLEAV